MNATTHPQVKEHKPKDNSFRIVVDGRYRQIIAQLRGKRVRIYQYDHEPTMSDFDTVRQEMELRAMMETSMPQIRHEADKLYHAVIFESGDDYMFN